MRGFIFLSILSVFCSCYDRHEPQEVEVGKNNLTRSANQHEVPENRVFLALKVKNFPPHGEGEKELLKRYREYLGSLEIKKMNRIFHFPKKEEGFSLEGGGVDLLQLSFSEEASLEAELKVLQKKEHVLFAETDKLNFIRAVPYSSPSPSHGKDLLLRDLSLYKRGAFPWWQRQVNFDLATYLVKLNLHRLNLKNGRAKPLVAVIDSGVDYSHPALIKRLWKNPHEGEFRCGKDTHGCNTTKADASKGILGTPDVFPFGTEGPGEFCDPTVSGNCAHGTQVAGVVLGECGDHGMIGLCPMCELMILRVMEDQGGEPNISDFAILQALRYIALVNQKLKKKNQNPVRIINASFGKFQRSEAISSMMQYLREAHEVLIVGASGNEATTKGLAPAAGKDVLSVGALNIRGERSSYSNYGYHVDLFAPGGDRYGEDEYGAPEDFGLFAPTPGESSCQPVYGTSFAAPVVSGAAGFLLSLEPNLTVDNLEKILLRTGFVKGKPKLDVKESVRLLLSGDYKKVKEREEHITCSGLPKDWKGKGNAKIFLWFLLFLPLLFVFSHRKVGF